MKYFFLWKVRRCWAGKTCKQMLSLNEYALLIKLIKCNSLLPNFLLLDTERGLYCHNNLYYQLLYFCSHTRRYLIARIYWKLCRIIKPVPKWHFCTRISYMCRKIHICYMIDHCLKEFTTTVVFNVSYKVF